MSYSAFRSQHCSTLLILAAIARTSESANVVPGRDDAAEYFQTISREGHRMGSLDSLTPKECVGVRLVSNHPALTHWRHKIPAKLRDKAFRYTLCARYPPGSEKASGSLMTGRILFTGI